MSVPNAQPNPTDPASFTWKYFDLNSGQQYRYIDQNEGGTDVVLCFHGFPDLAFGWRYQIVELVRRGYRVIVPDLLGYGGTSKPTAVEDYALVNICRSIIEILDHLRVRKVLLVGHDWGAVLSGRFLFYFPERVQAWVTICVPPLGGPNPKEIQGDWRAIIQDMWPNFGYQLYFMGDMAAEELTLYAKTFLLIMHCHMASRLSNPDARRAAMMAASQQPPYVCEGILRERVMEQKDLLESAEITDPETKYYVSEFQCGGLSGPLNWYKAQHLNRAYELVSKLPQTFPVNIPSLYIRATKDEALPPSMLSDKQLSELFPGQNLRVITIEGANHWLLQDPDYRDRFTLTLCDWIDNQSKAISSKL